MKNMEIFLKLKFPALRGKSIGVQKNHPFNFFLVEMIDLKRVRKWIFQKRPLNYNDLAPYPINTTFRAEMLFQGV